MNMFFIIFAYSGRGTLQRAPTNIVAFINLMFAPATKKRPSLNDDLFYFTISSTAGIRVRGSRHTVN